MYILTEASTMWPKRHHWCWDIGKKGTVGQCFYFPWMYFQTTCTPELDFSVPILCIVSTFLKGNSNPERNKNVGFANLQGVYLIHTVKYGGKSLKFHCPNVYKKEMSCMLFHLQISKHCVSRGETSQNIVKSFCSEDCLGSQNQRHRVWNHIWRSLQQEPFPSPL